MRLIGKYFPEKIFFITVTGTISRKQKDTVLVIDFYKYGGSEKTSEVKFA